jgi:predicted acetyltransferase
MIALRDVVGRAASAWLEGAYLGWLAEIGARRVDTDTARETLALMLASEDIAALLIERAGQPTGFALVRTRPSCPLYRLEDFYVLPAARRLGVGAAAARLLFDRFDGDWEIVSLQRDLVATRFWRQVLQRYTEGHLAEQRFAGEIRYRFASKGAR